MQKPLSEDFAPRKRRLLSVFDESLPEAGRQPFLGSAVVLVDQEWRDWLEEQLHVARLSSGYEAELKYRSLDDGRASRLAAGWLRLLLTDARHCLSLKVFVTDLETGARLPYPGEQGWEENLRRHLLAVHTAALTWRYPKQDEIEITFVFDDTGNTRQRELQAALPSGLQRRFLERRIVSPMLYAPLQPSGVEWLDSKPGGTGEEWMKRELIQMADVVLGGVIHGLKPQANSRRTSGRIEFTESVFEHLLRELGVPGWMGSLGLHRRVSASVYPDEHNFAYPAPIYRLRRIEGGEQLPLSLAPTARAKRLSEQEKLDRWIRPERRN